MNQLTSPESSATLTVDGPTSLAADCRLHDASIADIDCFIKTLSGIEANGVRPDLACSIITHYASKWIPELSGQPPSPSPTVSKNPSSHISDNQSPPESATAAWLKKRFLIETIVAVLPPEKDAVPCNFLLRLLKTANMVGIDSNYREELEKRVSELLDQATLKEVMIPCFSHVRATLLDVELMLRLVKGFVDLDIEGRRTGAGMFKVARLVDAYLAEAAVDSELGLPEFMELAGAVPEPARVTDDGLYRAVDTYLKIHVNVTKEEKKALCKLIDIQKLSTEASFHVTQNERLPIRFVIQTLLSKQAKPNSHIDRNRSLGNTKSPTHGLDPYEQYQYAREVSMLQQMEIKRLKENMARLETQCHVMQSQIDRLLEKKKGFFNWKKLAMSTNLKSMSIEVVDERLEGRGYYSGSIGKETPIKAKQGIKNAPRRCRRSTS